MKRRRGGVLIETALWTPLLLMFLLGTFELGRVTITYYQLKKVLYTIARHAGTQRAVNFCDSADTTLAAVKAFAVTGTEDASADPVLPGLQVDQIAIRIERYNAATDTVTECDCSATAAGCDAASGAPAPDYLVVSIPEGYPITLRIPNTLSDAILLKPVVRVPFGGL
jgi:Flp pilus assembly protein TadG